MSRFRYTKKLSPDEVKSAVDILYAHYGIGFVETEEDLAKEVSEQFDCHCTTNEVRKHFKQKTIDEVDKYLLVKNIFQ